MNATKWLALIVRLVGRSGDTMLRRSPRRALQAIVTKASAAIVALVGSDLKRRVTKQAQSKSIELSGSHDIARGGAFLAREAVRAK